MKSFLALLVLALPAFAADPLPLLKPAAVPMGLTRVLFPVEGPNNHIAASIVKAKSKQAGTGENAVEAKIALGTHMQAPVVATVKTLQGWGYKVEHMGTVTIPEVILIGRSLDSKSGEVRVKLTNVKVLAQLYVFSSDEKSLEADLWMRVDQLLGGTSTAQAMPRVWLGEPAKAMAANYPAKMFVKTEDDRERPEEPAPAGPDEGRVKIAIPLTTTNYLMPCTRLNDKVFPPGGEADKPRAAFTINNTAEVGGLIASFGLTKLFNLKKVNDDDGQKVFTDGKQLKILNSRTIDLRFSVEGAKPPLEHSVKDQPLLLDQEMPQPILWVGPGYLNAKIEHLTLAADGGGWKLHGFAKAEDVTPPVKGKK